MSALKPLVKAAIRLLDGRIYTGTRHGHILQQLCRSGIKREELNPESRYGQGFVDEDGTYYARHHALRVAVLVG